MTVELQRAARQLALEAAMLEVLHAFDRCGIRTVLLKGPAIASRLYDEPTERMCGDIDLLVEPSTAIRARRILMRLGFVNELEGARRHEQPAHATTWQRQGARPGTVDLHVALPWTARDSAAVWHELSRDTEQLRLGREYSVEILSEPAQAFVIAAHILQHAGAAKLHADLERALAKFALSTWREAAAIATRLDCEGAFAAGLRLTHAGTELLPALGLEGVGPTSQMRLWRAGAGPGSMMVTRLSEARSVRERASVLVQCALPSRTYMRYWSRREAPDWLPLLLAYAYRPFVVGRRLPIAIQAWRRTDARRGGAS